LSRNGFQFDNLIKAGVQYLSRQEEQTAREALIREQARNIPDMTIQPEDAVLITHIRESVQAWLATPCAQREEYLNIPGVAQGVPATLSRAQVRLTHQIVRAEFNGLHTQGMGHFVRITAPTSEQQQSAALIAIQNREQTISNAIGFRWIVEGLIGGNIGGIPDEYLTAGLSQIDMRGQTPKAAVAKLQEKLRKRKRVVVGHNCFADLVYFYNCFIGDLPESVGTFNEAIRELFPLVLDTKHIASFSTKPRERDRTSLAEVHDTLRNEERPLLQIPAEHNSYESTNSYHEAGYDSFLTAKIAILLSAKMEREGEYKKKIGFPEYSELLPAFDVDDDGYITANSSAQHSRASSIHNVDTFSEEVQTPTTAIKTTFDAISKAWSIASGLSSNSTPEVVAVKNSSPSQREKHEVDKLKHQMANTNIYSVLEDDVAKMPSKEDDLMSFSSESDNDDMPSKGVNMYDKIKNGELMPRWGSEFSTIFGNVLQVNSSKDRVNKLQ
jgi:hypothetical protein